MRALIFHFFDFGNAIETEWFMTWSFTADQIGFDLKANRTLQMLELLFVPDVITGSNGTYYLRENGFHFINIK